MSDPKYNVYAGELRFDDDNIVDVNLQPDTENITVRLNGEEITGGSELPDVDSGDNGKVLTVVSGEWAAAAPATPPAELPAVTSDDNGDVLTVVEGAWAKAAPAGGAGYMLIHAAVEFQTSEDTEGTVTVTESTSDILEALSDGMLVIADVEEENIIGGYAYPDTVNLETDDEFIRFRFVKVVSNAITLPATIGNVVEYRLVYEGSGETGVPGSWSITRSNIQIGSVS